MLVVAHGPAQLRDGGGEGAVDYHHVRPDGLKQFFLGYDFTGVEQKLEQNFQGLRFELDRLALDAKFVGQLVKFVVCETPEAARSFLHLSHRSLVVHA
jgi:hypothetical protein